MTQALNSGQQPLAVFCTGCGAPAGTGRFCAGCGTSLAAPASVPAQPGPVDGPSVIDLTDTEIDLTGTDRLTVEDVLQGVAQEDDAPQARRPSRWSSLSRRGRGGVAGLAVVLALALVAAGTVGLAYLRDADVRGALARGQGQYVSVMSALAEADDVAAVVSVAERAAEGEKVLATEAGSLGDRTGELDTAAAAQLRAESAVLGAVAGLAGLSAAPLRAWGTAHPALAEALAAEKQTRSALERADPDSVRGLPEGEAVLSDLAASLAPGLAADAADQSGQLLGELQAAKTTAQIRELAGGAAAQRSAVDAAATALPAGQTRTALIGMSTALEALATLGTLSGESTQAWDSARTGLTSGFSQVADGSPEAGAQVRAALPTALAAVDAVVQSAATAIADWQARYDAAVEARNADAAQLKEYADQFRGLTTSYGQLRKDLGTFTERVEDPALFVTYFDGYVFMSQATEDRRAIRDSLNAMGVPGDVRSAHAATVAVIDRSIRAVQAAYDGLEQSQYCVDCSYRDTPGWTTFRSESTAISSAYAETLETWESAVTAAEAGITNRELPVKPEV